MDGNGFETWARAATPRLLRLATLLTGSADEASDVVQDVLLDVYASWARISRTDNVDAYVTRMVVNRDLATRRSGARRARREHLTAVSERVAGPDDRIADRDELARALAELGDKQRIIVLLRHVDGLSDADIAAIMHCSPATVRSQSSRALQHLRSHLTTGSLT